MGWELGGWYHLLLGEKTRSQARAGAQRIIFKNVLFACFACRGNRGLNKSLNKCNVN